MDNRFKLKDTAIKFKTSSLFSLYFLINLFIAQSILANQSLAIITGTGIPISGLNKWYNSAPVVGLQYIIDTNENRQTIIEFHFQSYTDNSLSDREFYWVVDRNNYKSPDANANMNCLDFLIKSRISFPDKSRTFGKKQLNPFSSYGLGLYYYNHEVSGLIYPGQSKKPLDTEFQLSPIVDKRYAWGANIGFGFETILTNNLDLIIDVNYNTAIGYLRPFEDWGLNEVMPLQFLTIGLGFNYNY